MTPHLDPASPINWAHPLNRGLVAWYGAWPNPGWWGGATFRDLCRRSHGTLANGTTWNGSSRPFTRRTLLFDATNDRVTLASNLLATSTPFTLSWWERVTTNTNQYPSRFRLAITGGSAEFLVFRSFNATYETISWGQVGTPVNLRSTAAPSLSSAVGKWMHWCLVCRTDPTSDTTTDYSLYVDALSYAVSAGGAFGLSGNTLNYLGWDGADDGSDCSFDDVRVYKRALSASEVVSLNRQSRVGHPDTLRWLPYRTYFLGEDTGGSGVTVTPSAVTGSWTVPVTTVTTGATVTPSAHTGAWTLPVPTVTTGATVAPSAITGSWTIPTPTVDTTGGVTVTPSAITGSWTLPPPGVTTGSNVTPATHTGSWTIPVPSVTTGSNVTPSPLTGSWTVPTPTVTTGGTGDVVVTPATLVGTWTVNTPHVCPHRQLQAWIADDMWIFD